VCFGLRDVSIFVFVASTGVFASFPVFASVLQALAERLAQKNRLALQQKAHGAKEFTHSCSLDISRHCCKRTPIGKAAATCEASQDLH
jgi:hypothetical protein